MSETTSYQSIKNIYKNMKKSVADTISTVYYKKPFSDVINKDDYLFNLGLFLVIFSILMILLVTIITN